MSPLWRSIARKTPFYIEQQCLEEYSMEDVIMEEVQSAVESEMSGHLKEKLKVASLCDVWDSSKGGVSTFNRQLCITMAKLPVLEVSCILPEVSDSDKSAASKDKVTLIEADPRDPLVKLQHSPAEQSFPDVIISHSRKFGPGALRIKEGHPNCTWVHFVHMDYREMGKNKKPGSNEINANNTKDKEELDLCKDADVVVAVGPQLLDRYTTSLFRTGKKVHVFYPGLSDEFENLPVKDVENDKFHIYLFGRCSSEDFKLKGVDLIADAVKNLGEDYNLHIVGVPEGEEENIQQQILKTTRIKKSQLFVKSYCNNRDEMKDLMCEADMVVMPSRAEAYGLIGVEALSACVPLLVSAASGLGMTLKKLTFGHNCVVEADNSKEWKKAIKSVKKRPRSQRIEEMKRIRNHYKENYTWEDQCSALVGLFSTSQSIPDAICKEEYKMEDAMLEQTRRVTESVMSGHLGEKLKVVLLCDGYGSSEGCLSTLPSTIRLFAYYLNNRADVEVFCYLPEVSDRDRSAAIKYVTLVEAKDIPGNRGLVKQLQWPSQWPSPDVIINPGRRFGCAESFIKDTYPSCKWVQFVDVNYEKMGKYKFSPKRIKMSNENHADEMSCCRGADTVVIVGLQLLDRYSRSLSSCLSKKFQKLPQNTFEKREFHVFIFGCHSGNFVLKKVDVLVGVELDRKYNVHFVGVPEDEEAKTLEKCAARKNHFYVLHNCTDREELKRLLYIADVVVIPSAEAFGLIGLEALSAGIPLLVSAASGLGMTLKELTFGDVCVVESDDFHEWAEKIESVKEKERLRRIKEMELLRNPYDEKYKWEEQCLVLAKLFRDECKDGQGKGPTS